MNCNDNYEVKWNMSVALLSEESRKKFIFQLHVLIHTLKTLKEINKWFNVCMDK